MTPNENTRSRGHAWRSWRAYLNGALVSAPVNRRLVVVRALDVRLPGGVEAVLAEGGAESTFSPATDPLEKLSFAADRSEILSFGAAGPRREGSDER